jgi:hypothetical protein
VRYHWGDHAGALPAICRQSPELCLPCDAVMPGPDELLQLHNVYAASPVKTCAPGAIASPPRKRRPRERKPGASGLSPLPRKDGSLSPTQWKQWMHEAQELNASSTVFLATTSSASLAQAANEGLQLILNPVVAREDEKLTAVIGSRALDLRDSTTDLLAEKRSPPADNVQQWRSRVTRPRKRKKSVNLSIEPLLSDEVSAR